MLIARYDVGFGSNPVHYGEVEGDAIHELIGDLEIPHERNGEKYSLSERKDFDLLSPIEEAPMVICIGLNYRGHAAELKQPIPQYPIVFFKSLEAMIDPGDYIVCPKVVPVETRVDYEAELAVVIRRDCRDVKREDALRHVAGYTCANDVSARDWQLKYGGGQWSRSKMFDNFLPLGPFFATTESIPDPQKLQISTKLNGEIVQNSNTSDMIFPVAEIIEFLSMGTTLRGGTIILTGTPAGVGLSTGRFLKGGDKVSVTIEGIGTLQNDVVEG